MNGWGLIAASVVAGMILLAIAYHMRIRPWHLQWGTVGDEATRPLPGDDFAAVSNPPATHAIAIRAAAREVWPWLIQIGQEQGGFYSYSWLENLVGCQLTNADRIVPEWQHRRVGDEVKLHPNGPPLKVVELEENRTLVLGGRSGKPVHNGRGRNNGGNEGSRDRESVFSWAFVLDEHIDGHTRLIVRARGHLGTGWFAALANYLIGEPAHFVMQRKMLLGIKQRVEAESVSTGGSGRFTRGSDR